MISTTSAPAKRLHPLARFVTSEAIALLLNVEASRIKEIRCWANVILVVGKGISKFVSYADLPPILSVEAPNHQDFVCWRKRWQKNMKRQAPDFWVNFYAQKFGQSSSQEELYGWGQLVSAIKFGLPKAAVQALRNNYAQARYYLEQCLVDKRSVHRVCHQSETLSQTFILTNEQHLWHDTSKLSQFQPV